MTDRVITKDRNQFAPETVATLAKAQSYLRNPPKEHRSWTGAKRQRDKDPQYAVVSSKKLKQLVALIDPTEALEGLEAKIE